MRSPEVVRRLGWVLLVAGVFLVGLVGALTYNLAPTLLNPGANRGGITFSGTGAQGGKIIWLFATIIAFGLAQIVIGLFQIRTGRSSRILAWATYLGVAVILGAAFAATRGLGK
jgi:hypothetical protein